LPHALELSRHVHVVEFHETLLSDLLHEARERRYRCDMPAIVVHGGAGEDTPDGRATRRDGVERAADAGAAVLGRGGSALDAVVAAVVVLEDDPAFNAGLGSVLTEDGTVEMDASVMEGERLRAGAVGALRQVANPVLAALAVLREGREVLLVGDPG